MCGTIFAGRVLAHPNGGSLGSFETRDKLGDLVPEAPTRVTDDGNWRPIGDLVAAVLAGVGHDGYGHATGGNVLDRYSG